MYIEKKEVFDFFCFIPKYRGFTGFKKIVFFFVDICGQGIYLQRVDDIF